MLTLLTDWLKRGRALGIQLLDHVIVTDASYDSL